MKMGGSIKPGGGKRPKFITLRGWGGPEKESVHIDPKKWTHTQQKTFKQLNIMLRRGDPEFYKVLQEYIDLIEKARIR